MVRISNLRFEVTDDINTKLIADKLNVDEQEVDKWHLRKKSIDARKEKDIHYVVTIDIALKNSSKEQYLKNSAPIPDKNYVFPTGCIKSRPVIIGSGPAGLFAGLVLAENGHKPIIYERGEAIDERMKSVKAFHKSSVLNPRSNVQFGEGGAGTFSDGKLTTGIKNIRCQAVLEYFVRFGANEEILYDAKPHIGTDILCKVVKNIRNYIISCGGEVHFNSTVEDFIIENNTLSGIVVNGKNVDTELVILAIGHSARDTIRTLYRSGAEMISKSFSVGARIEHSQEMINNSQYKTFAKYLGAADYKLSCHLPSGRGVYTFCMCPGGVVVGAASELGGVVTNGMSYHSRNEKNSNSALLVGVNPSDFYHSSPLDGVSFQEEIEKKAFIYGGENYYAPAQRVGDFLNNIPSSKGGEIIPSYLPGVRWGSLTDILPKFVTDSMREAILIFDKKLEGFATYDAVLTAPETRSSSPVRILRDDTMQSNIRGLYPCGEGAGYAGGIMSAAVDGIACAEKLLQ